jgi:ABC-type nickel/cobalt efflux system permease component RcnA
VRKIIESLVRDLINFCGAFFFVTATDRPSVRQQRHHKKEFIMVNQQRNRFVKSRGVCKPTGKKRFFYTDAFRIARDERRRSDSNHHPYLCKACGDFHVGSGEGAVKNMRSPIRRKK